MIAEGQGDLPDLCAASSPTLCLALVPALLADSQFQPSLPGGEVSDIGELVLLLWVAALLCKRSCDPAAAWAQIHTRG